MSIVDVDLGNVVKILLVFVEMDLVV